MLQSVKVMCLLLLLLLQVQPLDPVEVLALEGQPVEEGVPMLLVHCATMAPLAIDAGVCGRRVPNT